jgi:flagellar biosynthesis protein FlhB
MNSQLIKDYFAKLPESMTAPFNSLTPEEQEKQIFSATELLTDYYKESLLTVRAVALQVLFILEAEGEEFARLKRHGVQSMSTKGTSVTFSRVDQLSPAVIDMLGEPRSSKSFLGRLI